MIHTARQGAKWKRFIRKLRPHTQNPIIDTEGVAVQLLERLWHATAISAKRGDIGQYGNEVIAEECGWLGDADLLIEILVDCGYLDECLQHRLVVHDWHEHAPNHVKGVVEKAIKRGEPGWATLVSDPGSELGSEPGIDLVSDLGGDLDSELGSDLGSEPKLDTQGQQPPNPTQPNLTQPNLTKPNPTQPERVQLATEIGIQFPSKRFEDAFWRWWAVIANEKGRVSIDSMPVTMMKLMDFPEPDATAHLLYWVDQRRFLPKWDDGWKRYRPKPERPKPERGGTQHRKRNAGERKRVVA